MVHYVMSDVVDEIKEREDNPANCEYDRFVGLEHYVSGEVEIRQYGPTNMLGSSMKVFHAGDILVARRNVYLRRAGVVNFDGITSGDSIVLRARDERIGRLLPFVLNSSSFWDYADKYSDGTMSKRLSPKLLMKYEFDLPEEDQQDYYADLLWAATETKVAYQDMIRTVDELVKSQFIEMFGDPTTVIKEATETVSDVADVRVGLVIKPTRFYSQDGSGTPAFRSLNVGEMKVNDNDWIFFTDKGMEENKKTIAQAGDVLVVRSGYPGTSCVVTEEFSGRNVVDLIIARPNQDRVLPEYLCAYTNYPHGKIQIENAQRGVAQKHFNVTMYNKMKIVVPPIEEQKKFVRLLQQSDKSKFELQQAIDSVDDLIRSIVQQDLN